MNQLPPIAQGERRRSFIWLIAAALGQGAMLVISALAVREAIGTVRSGDQIIPLTTLAMMAGAGGRTGYPALCRKSARRARRSKLCCSAARIAIRVFQ